LAAGFKYKIYFTASVEYDFSNEFSSKKSYHNHNEKNPDTNSMKMIPEKKRILKWLSFYYRYACLPSSFHFCDAWLEKIKIPQTIEEQRRST